MIFLLKHHSPRSEARELFVTMSMMYETFVAIVLKFVI